MPSITTWNRIEPRARHVDFAESLAARVHDPVWFLTRQWQLKEFRGEDGGSAVAVHLRGAASPITRVRLGADGEPRRFDLRTPLEVAVEREVDRTSGPTVRDAAEGGLVWLRMLEQNGLGAHRGAYVGHAPLAAADPADDVASARFRRVLAGRLPDGAALYVELDAALRPATGTGALPASPDVGEDAEAVAALALVWLEWWDAFAAEPAAGDTAWQPSKFEYRFAIAAPMNGGEVVFDADEYPGGHLDWYSFRRAAAESLGAAADHAEVRSIVRAVTPSPVEIPGNPTSRFWEFEDGRVDLARLEAAPEDIARLLLAEFAMVYGDDWLFVPVDLDAGTVFRTDLLEVHDTFGTVTPIPSSISSDSPDERWGFFHVSDDQGAVTPPRRPGPVFLLPPVLAANLDGRPIEEVLLIHDEMANLAWAVERHVASARGRAIDRAEEYQRRRASIPVPSLPPSNAPLRYLMHGRVPDYWVPLMPVHVPGSTRSIRLQRGSVRDPETGTLIRPLGRILSPETPLLVDEEDVPRGGTQVTRGWQYARWSDGGVHLWAGRRKRLGCREGWSGVRFDTVDRRVP
jgi:hypothetical protein